MVYLCLPHLQKVVEEEKQEHVDKVKELLAWVSGLKQSAQVKAVSPKGKELGDIEKSISEQQVRLGSCFLPSLWHTHIEGLVVFVLMLYRLKLCFAVSN